VEIGDNIMAFCVFIVRDENWGRKALRFFLNQQKILLKN
jgi:hypothetical protein